MPLTSVEDLLLISVGSIFRYNYYRLSIQMYVPIYVKEKSKKRGVQRESLHILLIEMLFY